jgi:DNA processing protein
MGVIDVADVSAADAYGAGVVGVSNDFDMERDGDMSGVLGGGRYGGMFGASGVDRYIATSGAPSGGRYGATSGALGRDRDGDMSCAAGRERYGGLSSRELWFWLSTLESVGPAKVNRLLDVLGSPEGIWETRLCPEAGRTSSGGSKPEHDCCEKPLVELKPKQAEEIEKSKLEPEKIAGRLRAMEKDGICFIGRNEAGFPDKLRRLPDCPVGLFVKGRLPAPDMPLVAVVGARSCDEYGRQMAEYFGAELAGHGIGVVSGMAAGIDGEGQRAALKRGGYSMAVLGCGVDVCYPKSNYNLYGQLIRDGGVVSESLPGTAPCAFRFPMRNRLISAFSDAVLVVEARERSGSLITADFALEQGLDVMAVPGRAGDVLSEGCNRLIKQGAALVTCVEDVCEALGIALLEAGPQGKPASGATRGGFGATRGGSGASRDASGASRDASEAFGESWEKILSILSTSPSHIDEISERTGIAVPGLMHELLLMEMRGLVRQVSQGQYVKLLFAGR